MNTPLPSSKPRLVPGIDIRKLPIGPEEAFVLSRVDGVATAREIEYATSFSADQVERCLGRLASLGAIEYAEAGTSPVSSTVNRRATAGTAQDDAPRTAEHEGRNAIAATPFYDPSELDSPADLDPTRKRDILELFYRLEALDHYQLLGIAQDAERRDIKAAYYEKVKIFHPDRYFGKNLGSFRTKLDQCFARLTAAHDTLVTAASREEYDGYLDAQRQTEEVERAIAQSVTIDDFDLLEQRMGAALGFGKSALVTDSSALTADAATPHDAVIDVGPTDPEVSATPKMSDEERKRFLARKLRVSSASLRAPPRSMPSEAPASSPPPSREQVADRLRRQVATSKRDEQKRLLESHLATADAALAANDPVSASNALRAAQSLAPEDQEIAKKLSETQAVVALTLSDTYLRQGEYEEKSGRFDAAARSYERAARGKPSCVAWESAARCLLEAKGDLRAASEFARFSIHIDPERAASHLVLGRIFLAARMKTSAIAELERARRLDPNNDTVANLLKRLANDEI